MSSTHSPDQGVPLETWLCKCCMGEADQVPPSTAHSKPAAAALPVPPRVVWGRKLIGFPHQCIVKTGDHSCIRLWVPALNLLCRGKLISSLLRLLQHLQSPAPDGDGNAAVGHCPSPAHSSDKVQPSLWNGQGAVKQCLALLHQPGVTLVGRKHRGSCCSTVLGHRGVKQNHTSDCVCEENSLTRGSYILEDLCPRGGMFPL